MNVKRMIFKVLLVVLLKISVSLAVIRDDQPSRELTVPLNVFATQPHEMSLQLEPPHEATARQYLAPSKQYLEPAVQLYSAPLSTPRAPIYTQAIFKPKPKAFHGYVQTQDEPTGYLSSNAPSRSYKFGYKVHSPRTGTHFGHSESRQNNIVSGKYFVQLPDGRLQTVVYTADEHGFHPIITYS